MNRVVKVVLGGWGIAVGLAILFLLILLIFSGPGAVDRAFDARYLFVFFVVGLIVSARYLK